MDSALVQQIVREVLARLQPALASVPGHAEDTVTTKVGCGCGCKAAAVAADSNGRADSKDVMFVTANVVTLDELRGRLQGVREVVTPSRSVVTPAVRDLLREKGVVLRKACAGASGAASSLPGVVVGVAETRFMPAAVLSALRGLRTEVQSLACSGLGTVVDELADHVARGGQLGLLFTDSGAAGVCLANRVRGVRAVLAGNKKQTRAAREMVGGNTLVIEPAGRSVFETQQIVRDFVQQGHLHVPGTLRSRLG